MRLLIVEDAERMAKTLADGFREEGFDVDVAADGEAGLAGAASGEYDLVLLDVNLPKLDGFGVIEALRRERADVPVIMVTARDTVADRVAGLDGGADDYVTKPFAFDELLARVRAIMRRPGARQDRPLRVGDVVMLPAQGQVERAGKRVTLSNRAFMLLQYMLRHPNRPLSREELHEAVWRTRYDGASNVLDVYVNLLRNRLGETQANALIHTVRGVGYQFGQEPF